jgi:hypothetical protein
MIIAIRLASAATQDDPEVPPTILLPRQALMPEQLGVVINDLDPTSRLIGRYYAAKRGIPAANLSNGSLIKKSSYTSCSLLRHLVIILIKRRSRVSIVVGS